MDMQSIVSENALRWRRMKINPHRKAEFDSVARRLLASKPRFQAVKAKTDVPWWVVAVIFERESGGKFTAYLGNGQSLDEVTTAVPEGRGPFLGAGAWERGCYDALIDCAPHASAWKDWSTGGALTLLERYNGLAYRNAGRASPYLWSGTDQYSTGKVLVDHGPIEDVYPSGPKKGQPVIDEQLGCAGLIEAIQRLDASAAPAKPAIPAPWITVGGIVAGALGIAAAAIAVPVWVITLVAAAAAAGLWWFIRRR
jgi:lysozyme family protein